MNLIIKNKIGIIVISVICVILMSIVLFQIYFIENIKYQIQERNNVIERLLTKDSLLNKILKIDYDSAGKFYNYTLSYKNDNVITYNELQLSLDSVSRVNRFLMDIHNETIGNTAKEALANAYKEVINKYNLLIDDYNELVKIRTAELESANRKSQVLSAITSQYKIKYTFNDSLNRIAIIAPSIDSAMALLPYYGNKIISIEKEKGTTVYKIERTYIK